MTDSWEAFLGALADETTALQRLNAAVLALTQSLVSGRAADIAAAERAVERERQAYGRVCGARRGMQMRGFGQKSLREVCSYAPRKLAAAIGGRISELATLSISIRIAAGNNKALIVSGMDRLMKATAAVQRAASEEAGTYKRRGFVPPPRNSVLVSSRA